MKTNKKLGVACGALAVAMVAGASFAYFTDRADTSAEGTAGTVGIDLASDMNYANEVGIMNPGDKFDSSFSISNTGNKSIDVRTTIKLTSTVPMNEVEGQCEFEIYAASDVELVDGEGYKPVEGAKPIGSVDGTILGTRTFDNNTTITYTIEDYVLNGVDGETEADVDTTKHDYDYVLVFRGDSKNAFQAAGVTVDVLVEAKQHRNTSAGWEVVAQEGYNFGAINQDAVPEA